ncbi:Maf family nucleotide pyrophosphatase [Acaricomes phytoseiuli]|uniref:Maf family protein n=1 Tax=Acaricomes phytoseiuli TaxID=291968 RepID=UPI00037C33C8|nr:Maf family protein [Acaricomes phytoseiuli]MCW1249250.1 Maf family nucleotide pyrophosphatase [Acaricomes phytoseiuli]
MNSPQLILASASPARTALLRQAGVGHRIQASSVDEDAVTAAAGQVTPAQTALLLARAKAEDVAARPESAGSLVIGCDSVFEFDGLPYGKPHEAEVARERIGQMSGRSGVLHTGHWLIDCRTDAASPGMGALASATVYFGDMSAAEIDAYVATGEPLEVAGSFTLDSLGSAFIERVDGDPHAVVGLSISTLRALLRETGVSITELWDTYKE